MCAQVAKLKENKSRVVSSSVAQKKSKVQQRFGFVDNRPEAIKQMKRLHALTNNNQRNQQLTQLQ